VRPACTVNVSLVLALPPSLRIEIDFQKSRELRENWPHQSHTQANIVAGRAGSMSVVGPSSARPGPNAVRPYVRRCWGRPGLPPRHPSFEIGRMSSVLSGLGIRRQDYSKAASNGGTPGAVHRVFTHRLHAVPRHGSRYIISRCRRASSIPGWVDSCRFPLKLLCLEFTSER